MAELGNRGNLAPSEAMDLLNDMAGMVGGDGVLFYDVSGDGQITEKREYVFTGLDPNKLHPDEARSRRARAPGSVVRLSRRPFATRNAAGATGGINRAGTMHPATADCNAANNAHPRRQHSNAQLRVGSENR